ncbi:SDR family oxidoreductase [Paenibacillus lemnae]|uniref:SDR family oxidoreductase n=2 Tax=Paenibacillus lemnae TaxID=1330551 RepID=A0A848M641_PAELE|nr:SDR family oxidoreductase [Paenibacillus lemnae]
MSDLHGKTALVTGASSGFGRLIAVELAFRGYEVIAGVRRPESLTDLKAWAKESDVDQRIHGVMLDVCEPGQMEEVMAGIQHQFGRLDVLVNNAGEAIGGFVEEVKMDAWRRQFEVNVFGTIAMTRAALPLMREGEGGTIILMSSISGLIGFPGYGPYAASKFALEGLGESLAMELEQFGIRVVLVEPGAYATPIWEKGFRDSGPDEKSPYQDMMRSVLGFSSQTADSSRDPREVAELIGYIAEHPAPKFRYMLPASTRWTLAAKRLLPFRMFRRLVLSAIHRKR